MAIGWPSVGENPPLVTRPTDNLEAYNLYLKGRHSYLKFTGTALEKGLECFTQALAVEPAYAQAHSGIALNQPPRRKQRGMSSDVAFLVYRGKPRGMHPQEIQGRLVSRRRLVHGLRLAQAAR